MRVGRQATTTTRKIRKIRTGKGKGWGGEGHSTLAIVWENKKIFFKQDSSLSLLLLKSQQDKMRVGRQATTTTRKIRKIRTWKGKGCGGGTRTLVVLPLNNTTFLCVPSLRQWILPIWEYVVVQMYVLKRKNIERYFHEGYLQLYLYTIIASGFFTNVSRWINITKEIMSLLC